MCGKALPFRPRLLNQSTSPRLRLGVRARCPRSIYFTTSYAFTFRDNNQRHSAQIRNSTNHEAQSGGSVTKIWLVTRRWLVPPISDVCRTNVPNRPAQTLLISDCKLKRLPQCVWNISLTIAVKTPGIKNNPTNAARDATFHLTQAEIVCVSSASRRIHIRLPRKTALAMGMLSQNHNQPSR